MNITSFFFKSLKKIFVISIMAAAICSSLVTLLNLYAEYGVGYMPRVYKEFVKDFLFRAYGPKTIP